MNADCKHAHIQTWRFEDSAEVAGMWSCADCGRRFEPVAAKQVGAEPMATFEQRERTLLEQYDLDQSEKYRKGYEDGRLKGYEVGHRHATERAAMKDKP
jgi:hypothetical protein